MLPVCLVVVGIKASDTHFEWGGVKIVYTQNRRILSSTGNGNTPRNN